MSLLATTQEAAETKFWRMPELIEKLLEYLDELSILSIVGVNLLSVEVLQTASKTSDILSKLIRKVLGFDQRRHVLFSRRTHPRFKPFQSRFCRFAKEKTIVKRFRIK